MAAKAIWLATGIAAALCVAVPALAQTAAPDCSDPGVAANDPACRPTNADGAVLLPDLIVDLFPNPVGGPVDLGGLPATPPLPTPDPRAPAPAAPATVNLAALPLAEPPQAITGAFVPDEVLVTVDGDASVVAELAAAFGLEVRSQRTSTLLGNTLVRFGIPDGRPVSIVLAQLAGDGRTSSRAPNHIYSLQQAGKTVNYAYQRIALEPGAATGKGVKVAVIDTAIDETHPALKGAVKEIFDAMPGVEITGRDHGTSVAGLIAGVGPLPGMAPGAEIYHARAFEAGRSTMETILSAIDWAADQDVRIINMSFVGPQNALLEKACANARTRDIVLVAAAGNNGPKAPFGYPGAYKGVIAVTATDDKDGLMQQANRGKYVFISAPGVNVIAPIGGGTDLVTGTSFAAAVASGAIANLIHAAPDRSADWIEAALSASAHDLGKKGRDKDFGYGLIDTAAAGAVR